MNELSMAELDTVSAGLSSQQIFVGVVLASLAIGAIGAIGLAGVAGCPDGVGGPVTGGG